MSVCSLQISNSSIFTLHINGNEQLCFSFKLFVVLLGNLLDIDKKKQQHKNQTYINETNLKNFHVHEQKHKQERKKALTETKTKNIIQSSNN